MDDAEQVRVLVEEALNSGRTPEEVCAGHPDLFDAVRTRWQRIRLLAADLEMAFPTSAPGVSPGGVRAEPKDSDELPPIPGYDVEAVIGFGGMGVVYKARHLKLGRSVAIKMLLPGGHASPRHFEGLLREAQAVARLKHPHIVQVHDVGELDGKGVGLPYFTMEFVEGGSLARKLGGKPLAVREAATLTATIADAVQAAHDGGIVHRDLKPANILLTVDGAPKISDFGLARRTEGNPGHTLSAARVGTPSYMAPEQARGTEAAFEPSVDVYALGAILYEALTGRPPFQSDSPSETHRQVIEEEPAPPSRLNARVPGDLETVCLKCLQKEPKSRYSSAGALAEDLRRFLEGRPVTARRIGPIGRAARWARRRPSQALLVAGCVLVVVGVAGLAAWAGWRRTETYRAVQEDVRQAIEREHALDWNGARALLERARGRLGDAAADSLRGHVKQLEDDLTLVARLERIRLERARFGNGPRTLANAEASREYEVALQAAGLTDVGGTPEQSVSMINKSEVREAVLSALDDWFCCGGESRPWVARALLDLDPDPWRNRLREVGVLLDRARMESLASTVQLDQQPPRLLLALGRALQEAGGDGISLLRTVQARNPADFWSNFELGLALVNYADSQEAIGYFRAALASRPDAAPVHFGLAYALMSTDHLDEAIKHYEIVIRMAPNHGPTRLNYGVCLQKKLLWKESIEQFREAIRINPDDADAHGNLGRAFSTLNRMDEAIAEYHESLRLDPAISRVHHNLAVALEHTGDRNAAMVEYEESLRLEPDNAWAHLALGRLFREEGRLRDAASHFQQVVTLQPRNADAKNDLRGVLLRLGESEQVRAAWQQELAADPADHPAWDGYAELCLFLGREAEYRRTCRELIERFGATKDPHVAERTARACLLLPTDEGQLAAAVALVDRALHADKSQYETWAPPFFMFAKGLADYRQNKFERALAVMRGEASTVLGPAPFLVQAMALSKMGEDRKAVKQFVEAIARFNWSPTEADIRDAWVNHILRREAEALIVPRLPAFLEGTYRPADNDERLAMLGACQFRRRYADMAGLYADVFATDPALAEDLGTIWRYKAARVACLAASGQDGGPAPSTAEECARWREQARQWLHADLAVMGKRLDSGDAKAPEGVRALLTHWRANPDLAGLRDPDQLDRLSADEHDKCLAVWKEVDELLARTQTDR